MIILPSRHVGDDIVTRHLNVNLLQRSFKNVVVSKKDFYSLNIAE
jgi:hypothetical protein